MYLGRFSSVSCENGSVCGKSVRSDYESGIMRIGFVEKKLLEKQWLILGGFLGNKKLKWRFLDGEAAKLAIYFVQGVFCIEEHDAGVRFWIFSLFDVETTTQRKIRSQLFQEASLGLVWASERMFGFCVMSRAF